MEKIKAKTISFKVSENVKEMMIRHYTPMKREKTPPYAIFQVKDFDCVTTLYESGKVVFQGIGADIEASFWTEQERVLNGNMIDTEKKKEKKEEKPKKNEQFLDLEPTIGSDEVGTGDYFGPLVVTASFVDSKDVDFLVSLGVRDSKKLTDDKIIKIAPDIMKRIVHTTIVLSNKEYNETHGVDMNMNKVKAILHNKCLLSVVRKDGVNAKKVIVDQFEPEEKYYEHLFKVKEKLTNIIFMTKAEDQCLAVAASSIISRYVFLKEIKRISEQYEVLIPLGASSLVDEVGATLVLRHGKKVLKDIAKLSFKNTERILEIAKARN